MTGKAKKVPSVMYEFMHVHALDNRRSSLLRAYEVDREQHEESAENSPRKLARERE